VVTKGLLVRLEARHDKDEAVERFLTSALPLVQDEPATTAWFAIRFGRHEYGIFDVFPDESGREAHLSGAVAKGLAERGDELFAEAPQIQKVDVLATKLPSSADPAVTLTTVTKGLLLLLPPKAGHEAAVADFLRGALPLVEDEPGTTAWFAIQVEDGRYGIFDVFPDSGARFAHLAGRVPRELAVKATALLGGMPDLDMLNVLAYKLPA
jgi:quinol monooxygenase YgiN